MHREHLKLIQEALRHDLPTILSGEEIRRLCSALEADARALWAVRVLDAWAEQAPDYPFMTTRGEPDEAERWCCWRESADCEGEVQCYFYAPTPDAARIAAATALYPDLPESVRRELGECP